MQNNEFFYLEDKLFKPSIFSQTKEGFLKKLEFVLVMVVFSGLVSYMAKITYENYTQLPSNNNLMLLGLIVSSILIPIIYFRKVYIIAFKNMFFGKKIRLIKYIKYLNSQKIDKLIYVLRTDNNLTSENKEILMYHIACRTLPMALHNQVEIQINEDNG